MGILVSHPCTPRRVFIKSIHYHFNILVSIYQPCRCSVSDVSVGTKVWDAPPLYGFLVSPVRFNPETSVP